MGSKLPISRLGTRPAAGSGGCGVPIRNADGNENIFRGCLGVFHNDMVVAVVGKDTRIQEFPLRDLPPPAVLLHQLTMEKFHLEIFAEEFHVGVGGGAVEI